MEKTRKWRKILAMMLTVVMMLQNAQSVMVFADVTNEQIEQRLAGNQAQTEETQPDQSQVDTRANGEEYKTQSQETQENGNGSTDIGSPESGNTTTEAKTSNADVSATITQSVFQADVSGNTCNFVQMTAQITNNDAENPATGVSVKALLNSAQLSWVHGYGTETAGAGAYAVDSNNTADLPDGSADGYDQIVMWTDQTIGAGETVAYQFAAQIIPENLDGVVNAWYVDGTSCSYTWENTEILVPTPAPVESTPEVAPPQTEPEEKPEVKPEETTPEVTEAPEVTPAPEVTEVPEATPTPEVTEVPEATPTPEVTEVPEATPTPETTQAVDDDKQAKLDEQNKLLGQSKDRLKIKKAKAPKAQVNDENGSSESGQPTVNNSNRMDSVNDLSESEYANIFEKYITGPNLEIYDSSGNLMQNYDPSKDSVSGGTFKLILPFAESDDNQMDNNPNMKYTLPSNLNVSKDVSWKKLEWDADSKEDVKNTYGNPGFVKVDASTNTLYVQMNKAYLHYKRVSGSIEITGSFQKTSSSSTETITVNGTSWNVKFDDAILDAAKSVSTYDEKNGFTFTIDIKSFGDPQNVIINDTLGDSLQLDEESIVVIKDGQTTKINKTDAVPGFLHTDNAQTFSVKLDPDWLKITGSETNKSIKLQYKAKIKDSALVPSNNSIGGLENSADIKYGEGGNNTKQVHAQGSYSVNWINKAYGNLQDDGRIEWILTVNANAKAKAAGLKVTDILQGKGLMYDTNSPIQVTKKNSNGETVTGSVVPDTIEWNPTNDFTYGTDTWSYTIPETENGKYEYIFKYYTIARPGLDDKEYGNVGTVSKNNDSVSTGTIIGPGKGTSGTDGVLSKQYDGLVPVEDDNGNVTKYAKWTATIYVPSTGLNQFVFTDTLSGAHSFVSAEVGDTIPKVKIDTDKTGINIGQPKIDITNGNKTMQILFGDDAVTAETSKLPSADSAYNLTITYYTRPDSETGTISNAARVTSVQKNGFDEVTKELKQYTFGKEGSVNSQDSKVLDWTITLGKGMNIGRNNQLEVTDVLEGNHTYYGNAHLYGWTGNVGEGTPEIYDDELNAKGDVGSKNITFKIKYPLDDNHTWTIQYQTRIDNSNAGNIGTTFTNKASFKLAGSSIGNVEASVDTTANRIIKHMGTEASATTNFKSSYSVIVDGYSVKDFATDTEHIYTIKDYSSAGVNIQLSTLKVVEIDKTNENNILNENVKFSYTYDKNQQTGKEHMNPGNILTVTIKANGQHKYKLIYDASIIPDAGNTDNSGYVHYYNIAEFEGKISGKDEDNSVKIDASATGTVGNKEGFISVYKLDKRNNAPLTGAKFKLQKYNKNLDDYEDVQKEDGSGIAEGETADNGKIIFTQEKLPGENYIQIAGTFEVNAKYRLVETSVPKGYKALSPEKEFIFGKDSSQNLAAYMNDEIDIYNEAICPIKVKKVWDDGANSHSGDTIEVKVKANGSEQAGGSLNQNNNWEQSWTDLLKYDSKGNEITYTVSEESIRNAKGEDVTGKYEGKITLSEETINGVLTKIFTITNYKKTPITSRTVKKRWEDNNNSDNNRPSIVYMQLYRRLEGEGDDKWEKLPEKEKYTYYDNSLGRNVETYIEGRVELIADKDWSYTWSVLPEKDKNDKNEKSYEYQIREQKKEGNIYTDVSVNEFLNGKDATKGKYTLTSSSVSQDGKTYTFTNTYDYEKVSIPVKKVWDTKGKIVDTPTKVKVKLSATVGQKTYTTLDDLKKVTGKSDLTTTTLELSGPSYEGSWNNLAKYYGGSDIIYNVEEDTSDLSSVWKNEGTTIKDGTYVVTNSYEVCDAEVTKEWNDDEDRDKKRPDSISVSLKATTTAAGDITKNIFKNNEETQNITKDNNWVFKWKNLPKYYNGYEIQYTVTEQTVNGYKTSYSNKGILQLEDDTYKATITNNRESEKISVRAEKEWKDDSNRDGKRPSVVYFRLYKKVGDSPEIAMTNSNGKPEVKEVSRPDTPSNTPSNNWFVEWNNLPKYENGVEIIYSVKEVKDAHDPTVIKNLGNDYVVSQADENNNLTIVNTYKPKTVSKTVKKVWADGNNVYLRKDIEVQLKAEITVGNNSIPLDVVTYKEKTNTFDKVENDAKKILKLDNETHESKTVSWNELPKYYRYKGETYEITYSVEELNVPDYYGTPKYSQDGDVFTITNSYVPEKTNIIVSKIWDDNADSDGVRPNAIEVQLLADGKDSYTTYKWNEEEKKWKPETHYLNGKEGGYTTITPPENELKASTWSKEWTGLPKYRIKEDGTPVAIEYTVKEKEVKDYTLKDTTSNGNTITLTNTHETDKISKQLIKYWRDDENASNRPKSLEFALYMKVYTGKKDTDNNKIYTEMFRADNDEFINKLDPKNNQKVLPVTESATQTISIPTKEDGDVVTCSWNNLPKNFNGEPIVYEVREINVPEGYQSTSVNKDDHTAIYNTTAKVEVSKTDLTGENEIGGAKLQIVDPEKNSDDAGYIVENWTSEEGKVHVVSKNLVAGKKYRLEETSAPAGYSLAAPVTFTIGTDGKTTKVIMKDAPIEVKISKTDIDGNEIGGAKFQIVDPTKEPDSEEYVVEKTWTSLVGASHTVEAKLEAGKTYKLIEVEAPSGYIPGAEITFTVTALGKVLVNDKEVADNTIVVTNEKNAISFAKLDKNESTDENPVYVKGAKLEIRTSVDGKPGEIATDASGNPLQWESEEGTAKTVSGLPAGEYFLIETEAPEGYKLASPVSFKVEAGKTDTISVKMYDEKTNVSILKVDKEGKALSGATLEIQDASKNPIKGLSWVTDDKAHDITGKLTSGQKYYLVETKAPDGYTIADPVEFTLNDDGEVVVNDEVVENGQITMTDIQTSVTISKKAITGEDSIGGAKLQILDSEGKEVVKTWETEDKKDKVVTGVLKIGETYTLHEVTPPAGYANADDIKFVLTDKGEIVINDKVESAVVMRDAKLQIKVSKKDITDTDELPGAVLQILDKADNSVIAEWKTADKPVIITEKDCKKPLVAGNTYILHEKTAPDGYAYAKDVEFTVHVDSIEGNEQLVTMHDAKNVVVVSKTDLAGTKELPGAKLQILSSDGKTVLESWTSTNEEYKVTKKLKAGESYILREIEAPDGYAIADDVKFTVNKDGSTTKVVMKDAQTSVTVSKTDLTGEKEIAGAKLQILNKNGKVMEEWTSDGKTHAVTAALVADVTYTLHEVSAPAGYRTAKDIEFTVDKTGKTTKVVMKDAPTKASILKTDESGKALSGAQLVVKDSTGKELDKWTSDGKAHEITGLLTVGETYTLSEVSAPSGYTVAPDQTFKMEDKDVIEVTMVDYQASGSGQITVTKKVTYANGGDFIDLIAQDDTFYVNLFTDAAGKYPYKGALPQAIHLVNASAGSVTFSDLAQGTYYVYETDANGNVINLDQQSMHNGSQFMCTVDGGSNTVKLDLKAGPKEGAVNLENVFFDIPTGYSYKGEININKQVLKGTTQTTTDDTFYAGVFTKGDDGVYNLFTVVTLVQNDTVTVEVPLGGKDGTEPINYYILETDADGNILDLDVFEYEVTGEGTVALSKDNLAGNINLVNKIPEDTDGKLRVQKTDGNGVGLAGASFRLTDEDGSVIDEWTSEASAHELELEPGTYTLTEVQAPTGYTGAGSVTIKVDDDYNFSVSGEIDYSYKGGLLKIVNKATTSTPSSGTPVSGGSTPASYSSALSGKVAVKTGDNTPIGAYAAVLVIAALAIAGGIFYKKKRKNDK